MAGDDVDPGQGEIGDLAWLGDYQVSEDDESSTSSHSRMDRKAPRVMILAYSTSSCPPPPGWWALGEDEEVENTK